MKKQYRLYRQSLANGEWIYDDTFNTKAEAENMVSDYAENSSWKVWKIEEVYVQM